MHYLVSLSGGLGSAIAAELVIRRYGRDAVDFWMADTMFEDEDTCRFIDALFKRWGGTLALHRDGRTPLQVYDDAKIIPNDQIAPCSKFLKIIPFGKYLQTYPIRPLTVVIGLGPNEPRRHAAPRKNWEKYEGVTVEYPLLWEEAPKPESYYDWVDCEMDISPPRLYNLGFEHNNCGGRCIRGGKAAWLNTLKQFPERFEQMADWEESRRSNDDARNGYTFLRETRGGERRRISLRELEARGTV